MRRGPANTTVIVDATLAAVVEMIEEVGSDTTLHVTIAYDRRDDGVAVVRRVRTERRGGNGGKGTITDVTFRNIFIAKGE